MVVSLAAPKADESIPRPKADALPDAEGNIYVYFDLSVWGRTMFGSQENSNRMIFKLYAEKCPFTCENFRALCTGEFGAGMKYEGSKFHRVIAGFMWQGGDYTTGDGTGGEWIYAMWGSGGSFPDEREGMKMKHTKRGQLSMANRGPGTNSSQFFVLFGPQPHLDGKHCVFGELVEGWDVLKVIETVPTRANNNRPETDVVIVRWGELERIRYDRKEYEDYVKLTTKRTRPKDINEDDTDEEDDQPKKKKKKKEKKKK